MFWLLAHDVLHQDLHKSSQLNSAENHSAHKLMIEIGPRPTMTTAFSTNAVSACRSAGIKGIQRLEQSQRYLILLSPDASQAQCAQFQTFLSSDDCRLALLDCLGDKMTECEYLAGSPPNSEMLHKEDKDADEKLGLALDQSDFDFYLQFFRERLQRNPTDVELFDLAQSNSEHSRHWFFKGNMVVDGVQRLESLFKTIQKTQLSSNNNNVICFSDNSSAIKGFPIKILASSQPQRHSLLTTKRQLTHIVYTAETHNFPTGVCPFPGAATGVGGRIRDNHATGRGAHEIAGLAAMGREQWKYSSSLSSPVKILLEASDGASDYGNKFGEPIISGFTRTFGMQLQRGDSSPEGERIEYIKPIMFSGGIGSIDDSLITKVQPQKGQLVAKIGGPVYRIGVGGGAASSLAVQGKRENAIDYGAVQRGDPEMEQKLHRLIRSCAELGADANPILSIHDQGAGGNGNVLKEIVESTQPESQKGGAIIHADAFELGDSSITLRELWGAEYQESDAILLDPTKRDLMQKIADRERCSLSVVGQVTGDGRVVLTGFGGDSQAQYPVDLDLEQIAEREPKTFNLTSGNPAPPHPFYPTKPLTLDNRADCAAAVCWPTTHPLADVGVVALSYWEKLGAAVALGEQPVKGLVNPGVGARMSVGEALTNLVFAPITCIEDVKCSGNWMWAAKLPEEGTRLVAACDAMCALMAELGVAVDGGKDSLSMATQVEDFGVVKAPGTLVITAYAPCVDITKVITPDFKPAGSETTILHLSMASQILQKQPRLGGSALAQCHAQLGGQSVPNLDDAAYFKHCFNMVQNWIKQDMLLSGHDVSDGGLLTAVLECAFAGNCSVQCFFNIPECYQPEKLLEHLFAEELGLILEVQSDRLQQILLEADKNGIRICEIGQTLAVFGPDAKRKIKTKGDECL
uniref:Phosphoribosylformylglycinamidine synthase n=1 Tax=Ditylenchus dipsaci TaxID=166011 RepID=A0A915E9Z7_9BILA